MISYIIYIILYHEECSGSNAAVNDVYSIRSESKHAGADQYTVYTMQGITISNVKNIDG